MIKTLEEYFRENSWPNTKAIDHIVRVEIAEHYVAFYVHPNGVDGDTQCYVVRGNSVEHDPRVGYPDGQDR